MITDKVGGSSAKPEVSKQSKEKRLKHKVSGYKSQSKRRSIAGCRLLLRTLILRQIYTWLCKIFFFFALFFIVMLLYSIEMWLKTIQYNAIHKFVGVLLDNSQGASCSLTMPSLSGMYNPWQNNHNTLMATTIIGQMRTRSTLPENFDTNFWHLGMRIC